MKLSGDTITTANTVAVFHALMTAAEKARRIMRMAEDSDINPHDAASRINALISTMNLALAEVADPAPPVPANLKRDLVKPEPEFRYFYSQYCIWKMPRTGNGFARWGNLPWAKSNCDLSDFLDGSETEVTAEEAEL